MLRQRWSYHILIQQLADQSVQAEKAAHVCVEVWWACLTTELSMVLMQLWLMSSVVRFLHTGMTAVTGQPDSAPSGSHCENSLASGTRIAWRKPEHTSVHNIHPGTCILELWLV